MKFTIKDSGQQASAEILAALTLANKRLASTPVAEAIKMFAKGLRDHPKHYLYLRDPEDLGSFFGCGTAEGGADTMAEDGRTLRLYECPREGCPNCSEEEPEDEEPEDEEPAALAPRWWWWWSRAPPPPPEAPAESPTFLAERSIDTRYTLIYN